MQAVLKNLFLTIAVPVCLAVIVILWWVFIKDSSFSFARSFSFALIILPIFLPFLLFFLMYEKWMEFVRTQFWFKRKRVTLRIKLPQEVFKSPEAMESVLIHTYTTMNPDNFYEAYIDGKFKLPISLELVSIGGDVRLYANLPNTIKDLFETQMYAQYPGIELEEELIDYTNELQWNEEMGMISFHVVKKEDEVLPIKTYIDFGHDKLPKEEEKFEPMTAMIEFLSTVKSTDRVYIQILCTPHCKESFEMGYLKKKGTWEADAKAKINEMMQRDEKGLAVGEETESRPMLTMGERDTISAIERNTSKLAFKVGIRTMYVALDGSKFEPRFIAPTFTGFAQFGIVGRNALAPRWKTDFDYKWFEDRSGNRVKAMKKQEITHFKIRKYDPGDGKINDIHRMTTMSVEEIATIFHIPGSSVLTPGLSRVPSVRRDAPSNLPTGDLPN